MRRKRWEALRGWVRRRRRFGFVVGFVKVVVLGEVVRGLVVWDRAVVVNSEILALVVRTAGTRLVRAVMSSGAVMMAEWNDMLESPGCVTIPLFPVASSFVLEIN